MSISAAPQHLCANLSQLNPPALCFELQVVQKKKNAASMRAIEGMSPKTTAWLFYPETFIPILSRRNAKYMLIIALWQNLLTLNKPRRGGRLCGRFVGLTAYFLAGKGWSGIIVCTVWLPCPQTARKTPRPWRRRTCRLNQQRMSRYLWVGWRALVTWDSCGAKITQNYPVFGTDAIKLNNLN